MLHHSLSIQTTFFRGKHPRSLGLHSLLEYRTQVKQNSQGSTMDEQDFEGSLVLEMLAEINKVDAFFEAIDSDDFAQAKALMKNARIDAETISLVLKKMGMADDEC